jgi:holo-[acyl-carrier protein] synthase
MIIGIGTDIVEIARIDKVMKKFGKQFYTKILSQSELIEKDLWEAKDLAKRFCAKEAVSKALGTGFSNGLTMPQITITHDKKGKPEVKLFGIAKQRFEYLEALNIQISISDEKNNAIAFCIIEN